MKKVFYIILLAMALAPIFSACSNSGSKSPATETKAKEQVVYVCPMHSEVTSDKPGKCPKCGMELEKKTE